MSVRKLTLRILLGSLALAAAAGVLGVLLGSHDVMGRVSLTALSAALAAGFILPLLVLTDRRRTRAAGLAGICMAVVEFVAAMALIWLEAILRGGLNDRVGISMVLLFVCGVPAVIFLVLLPRPTMRLAAICGLVGTTGAFAWFMAAAWWPRSMWQDDRAWGTGWTVAGLGCVLLGCLAGLGPGHRRHWRWIGVLGSLVAALIVLLDLWGGGFDEKSFALAAGASLFVAFANLLLMAPLKGLQVWVRTGTVASGAATALLVDLLVFTESYQFDDWPSRFTAAAAILAGCGSLAVLVLWGYNRRVEGTAPTPGSMRAMAFSCPRCGRKCAGGVGENRCAACGLHIKIVVEEPACAQCGYALYGPPDTRCPECGVPGAGDAAPAEVEVGG